VSDTKLWITPVSMINSCTYNARPDLRPETAMQQETITAIATAPGRGGVGIIRVSGPASASIAKKLLGFVPSPRQAKYCKFLAKDGVTIDEGIALFFKNPHSFTGEDVLELQGHGGPIVLDSLLKRILDCGACLAKPGEFSEQAFLNNKMDLIQAEAIADLINAESEQAARSAVRSLQGEFSQKVNGLVKQLIHLRMYVEAAIDFPEEEIDFLKDSHVVSDGEKVLAVLEDILKNVNQGVLLRDGISVVIVGPPNAGKSSLLNALSGRDSAIVTEIAGTTRDVLREQINIDGMPIHIIDTAGLRETSDVVEKEGVKRARQEVEKADVILCVLDSSAVSDLEQALKTLIPERNNVPLIVLLNKIDLVDDERLSRNFVARNDGGAISPKISHNDEGVIKVSIKNNTGLDALKENLKNIVGYQTATEGNFIARRRHLDCLEQAKTFVENGLEQITLHNAGELLAEDLRQAQESLSKITGEFTSDDLLGEIFSSFCIGK
jgi:tRNA modification GTPase